MDLWIEVTMNLGSSLKAGWLNLLQNDKQLFSTIRNSNNIGKICHALELNLKSIRKLSKHVEYQPAWLKKNEQAIQNILLSLDEFKCDLFDSTNPTLRSIQFGIKATEEVALDFNDALPKDKIQVDIFLDQRIFSEKLKITDRPPKNKRLTFDNNKISKKEIKLSVKHKWKELDLPLWLSFFGRRSQTSLRIGLQRSACTYSMLMAPSGVQPNANFLKTWICSLLLTNLKSITV